MLRRLLVDPTFNTMSAKVYHLMEKVSVYSLG
jgi:hypothetical protein